MCAARSNIPTPRAVVDASETIGRDRELQPAILYSVGSLRLVRQSVAARRQSGHRAACGESGGPEALPHKDRRRSNLRNRVGEAVEQAVMTFVVENTAAGPDIWARKSSSTSAT